MDWSPIWLSLKLATITTCLLLIIGLPLAYWLSKGPICIQGSIGGVDYYAFGFAAIGTGLLSAVGF
jgi:ABC-type molybdate transport system permease subunit